MKIAILSPRSEFNKDQISRLESLGEISFTETRDENPFDELLKLSQGAEILAIDPDVCGGFEKAKANVNKLIDAMPQLKGICLGTTSFGWVDLEHCKEKKIMVSNCPGWSRNSVAEQTITFILATLRRVILTDRETQAGKYQLKMSHEVNGKTLGIIGLGSIGSRVADLAHGLGMKVIAYNRTRKSYPNVEIKEQLDDLLSEADVIALHITHSPENINLIGVHELSKVKKGVIFVNLADRESIDETAMAQALKDGTVGSYIFELEKFEGSPLTGLENVIMMKPFAWFTQEALDRLIELWTKNIEAMTQNNPQNLVSK